ncbi:MAG: hypothetical protein FWC89_04330 [Defluviitaleaceae bacterium]|nr:hypothetical protein [Defluviitaleaceae bacterium]
MFIIRYRLLPSESIISPSFMRRGGIAAFRRLRICKLEHTSRSQIRFFDNLGNKKDHQEGSQSVAYHLRAKT